MGGAVDLLAGSRTPLSRAPDRKWTVRFDGGGINWNVPTQKQIGRRISQLEAKFQLCDI